MALASSLVGCEEPEVSDPTRWTVDLHGADVFVFAPDPQTSSLSATDERLGAATTVEVLATDGAWFLLADGFRLIRAANIRG